MVTLNPPPALRGAQAQQLEQIRSYLFIISDQLNQALNNLTEDNFAKEVQDALTSERTKNEDTRQNVSDSYGDLKSLIIKTASSVRAEMDLITTTLQSNYVAKSDFGTYTENINTQITQTAAGVKTAIDAIESVQGQVNSGDAELEEYISKTAGYILQGIVGYDGANPIIGIAIGQDLTTTGMKTTINGKEYAEIDKTQNMSVWTTQKLSFFISGTEVAYFSNGALHVGNIEVGNKITGNNEWEISFADGFSINWIGG